MIRRAWPSLPESEELGHPPRVVEDGFLRYHLDVETNFGREEGILRTYLPS